MQSPQTIVIADDREANSAVVAALCQMERVDLKVHRLKIGDYLVNNNFLFERKTLTDFTASIKDGRLFRQIKKLANSSVNGALILEGTAADLSDSRMTREAIQGAIVTVSIIFGVPILRAMDADESASLMIFTSRQIRRFSSNTIVRPKRHPKGKKKAQIYLLQSIPEIGPERAKKLIEKFGSVEMIFRQDVKQLMSVPQIGKKAAKAIRWVVG